MMLSGTEAMLGRAYSIFDTAIGRCAIAWGDAGIVGVHLPETREIDTRRRLFHLYPEARESKPTPNSEAAIEGIARGEADAGPMARLSQSERFGWIVAPASTIIQPSPTHTGLTDDPAATLERLFAALVASPATPDAAA